MPRVPIPDDVAADILFAHDRTCCVCNEPGKAVQIHHIDDDPSNNTKTNLAVLCLQHHAETQIRGGFGRKLRDVDVRTSCEDWLRRVSERRPMADEILLKRMTALPIEGDVDHWVRPSDEALATTLATLPDVYEDIYNRAVPLLGSIVRTDMFRGLLMIIDVHSQAWIRLASWFPPKHFGNMRSDEFMVKYISDRFNWNLALWEPDGPGSGGREAALHAYGGTLDDVERTVVVTVRQLGLWLEDFDFNAWEVRWKSVWNIEKQ